MRTTTTTITGVILWDLATAVAGPKSLNFARQPKSAFFDTNLAVFPKIFKISIQSYTFLKSASNFALNGIPYVDI